MSVKFWKRKKFFPGVTLNISKSGLSLSFGFKGFHYTIPLTKRTKTTRITFGIPGTGLFFTKRRKK